MKIKKSFLSVCLSISLMFGCFVPSITAYAVGDSWTSAESYHYFENHFEDINTRLNGVIINQNRLQESFEDYLDEYRDNYNIPSGTSTQTWIGDNISGSYQNGSSGVADVSFSETFRQAMRDWIDAYLEANTGFIYAYSLNSALFLNSFNDQDHYHAFLNLLDEHGSDYIWYYQPWDKFFITSLPLQFVKTGYISDRNCYNIKGYTNWEDHMDIDQYTYDSTNKVYSLSTTSNADVLGLMRATPSTPYTQDYNNSWFVTLNTTQYIVYKTYDSMRAGSEGVQEYYTVSDSYNSSISGSYNTTTNNIETTLNNNDVNNYINNYYVQNGSYPTPQQISVYITNNIDSGSGGSGGNGSGDNDGPNWDFGFLGTIGEFLAELISGFGEIVGGILSAITSIVSSLREGIPNTIGLFLEWFFPFLPTEIVALIELSILCAVILGVVRLIRGH